MTGISQSGPQEIKRVDLEASHARHLLKPDTPDFEELLSALRAAQEAGSWLIVTETDEHEIIDVRPSPGRPGPPEDASRERSREPTSWLSWLLRWLRQLSGYMRSVSRERASKMFDLVRVATCDPLTAASPCIPFLYPDDGCWARAHEMCRLMIAESIDPKKVWLDGDLDVQTNNNPTCAVSWSWHVAPTVRVKHGSWRVKDMVIDPSLFTEPVSKEIWKKKQGDPGARLTATDASVYWRDFVPTDPNYTDTDYRLQYYRLQLKNRSLQAAGPPPYANCA